MLPLSSSSGNVITSVASEAISSDNAVMFWNWLDRETMGVASLKTKHRMKFFGVKPLAFKGSGLHMHF